MEGFSTSWHTEITGGPSLPCCHHLPAGLPGLHHTRPPDCCLLACWPAGTPVAIPATTSHRRAPNLPRRSRQTGLNARGVTPELLRLKFYCSWTEDIFFFFLFFKCLFVLFTVWLSTISPCWFLWFSFFIFSFSFSFYSFFLGFVSFTIVS
jgi:hypothetical protein